MSDADVEDALRSDARLVLVEAPAGCGKTYQGAQYAKDVLPTLFPGRLLILTHTNAACDVFAGRTQGFGGRVEVRTIDSVIIHIASAYHKTLGLPPDVPAWARHQANGAFNEVAMRVAGLLARMPSIAAALTSRYRHIICDEHQDASEAQHRIVSALHAHGASLRIFGDHMQAIYMRTKKEADAWNGRWTALQAAADRRATLDTPHRWKNGAAALGDWIQLARADLEAGRQIDLRGNLPQGLTVISADNTSARHGQYATSTAERRPIDRFVDDAQELAVLTCTNDMVRGLRAFFFRRVPVWEGHVRDALSTLVVSCRTNDGNAAAIAHAFVAFMQEVSRGFSDSAYGNRFRDEVAAGCVTNRAKKPAKIQELARFIVEHPNHRGVARALARLIDLVNMDNAFDDISIDLWRELKEATCLDRYDDPDVGLAEITLRRTAARTSMPTKVISTVHKAKGVERESVLIMPCDNAYFPDTEAKRRLLYVAISRATKSLALVLPRRSPHPLFRF